MGFMGLFLIMGNAGFISSTVSGPTVPSPCLDYRGSPDDGDLRTDSGPDAGCRVLGFGQGSGCKA